MKVVGYSKFNSKKGFPCCFLFVVYPPLDNESNVSGLKAEQIFIPEKVAPKVTDSILNKDVDIIYNVVAGKAFVADIRVN